MQKIGYVYFSPDKTYYSVPYRYIGKSTLIHYTPSTVEVYYYHERIALHQRNASMGVYITNKTHLSSTHKDYTDWSPEYFKKMAARHGQDVLACVEGLFISCDYPETAYKRAMGIIQLHRVYGSQRLNNACKRAVYGEAISYNRIKNILANNLDKEYLDTSEEDSSKSHIPPHDNIRGQQSFQ